MKQYQRGLVIGRFQPFHKGHAYLLQKAFALCDKLVIGIGSSNISDQTNPFSYEFRKYMIQSFLEHEGLDHQVLKIIPIPDIPSDEEWFEMVKKEVGNFDIYIGNDDWTTGIMKDYGYQFLRVGFLKRDILEATQIRTLVEEGKPWEDRVPSYLIQPIKHYFQTTKAL